MKNKLIALLILALFIGACESLDYDPQTPPYLTDREIVFDRPYKVEIIGDHKVQCTYANDTINLYFENAHVLHGETKVFIEQ